MIRETDTTLTKRCREVDYRDKLKHIERRDQLFVEMMMLVAEKG